MEIMEKIPVQKTEHSRLPGVDLTHLEFGKYISDHMFMCQYSHHDWHQAEIIPYQDLVISPIR